MEKIILKLMDFLKTKPKYALAALALFIVMGSNGLPVMIDFTKWSIGQLQGPKMGKALVLTGDAFAEMNRIRSGADSGKVLLLRAHDSGRPRPGTPMYSSVVHEVWANGRKEIAQTWQNQILDEPYIIMLRDIYDTGGIHLITEQMPDSVLKTTYLSLGVTHSYVARVHTTDKEIFYISVTWYDRVFDLTPTQLNVIRSGTTNLASIIKEGEGL